MEKVYLIEHWKGGYWSKERQKFGGILFATRYYSQTEAEMVILEIDNKGPVFVKIGWERKK